MAGNARESVDAYIMQFSAEVQEKLKTIRETIQNAAPEAEERISYGMPAYNLNGPLVYFAANKNHIGFYPTADGNEAFRMELAGYKSSKGAVQFPLDRPVPYELIERITAYRAEENRKKPKRK
jgi:uncharacterized protein YdhG (YjbR/CyaY superfamily)